MYQDERGMTTCKACGAGTYSSGTTPASKNAIADCLLCTMGFASSGLVQEKLEIVTSPMTSVADVLSMLGLPAWQQDRSATFLTYWMTMMAPDTDAPLGLIGHRLPETADNEAAFKAEMEFRYNGAGCLACRPGRINTADGSDACEACAKGRFQPFHGIDMCYGCPAGRFSDVEAAMECPQCLVGKF
jgi:rubredoxin